MRALIILTAILLVGSLVGCSTTEKFKFPEPPELLMRPPGKLITIE